MAARSALVTPAAQRQRLAFHRSEHGAVIGKVTPAEHFCTGCAKVDWGRHSNRAEHRQAVPAFAHKLQHEIAAKRLAMQNEAGSARRASAKSDVRPA
jgi:hypothetical protein